MEAMAYQEEGSDSLLLVIDEKRKILVALEGNGASIVNFTPDTGEMVVLRQGHPLLRRQDGHCRVQISGL